MVTPPTHATFVRTSVRGSARPKSTAGPQCRVESHRNGTSDAPIGDIALEDQRGSVARRGGAEDHRGGAVVDGALGAHAPVDVVVRLRPIHRFVAIVAIAQTPSAAALAATVVVTDDVALAVGRILASADPRE